MSLMLFFDLIGDTPSSNRIKEYLSKGQKNAHSHVLLLNDFGFVLRSGADRVILIRMHIHLLASWITFTIIHLEVSYRGAIDIGTITRLPSPAKIPPKDLTDTITIFTLAFGAIYQQATSRRFLLHILSSGHTPHSRLRRLSV